MVEPENAMTDRTESDLAAEEARIQLLELVRGEGFLVPGGPEVVRRVVRGLDLHERRVLDVGCGSGGAGVVLAREFGARVVGLDVGAAACRRARETVARAGLDERIDIRQFDPGLLPIEDVSIDLVFGNGKWGRLAEKPAFFGEVFRVLKPDGVLAASDWMKAAGVEGSHEDQLLELAGQSGALETAAQYRRILEERGFVDIELRELSEMYRSAVRREYQTMQGPLAARLQQTFGSEGAARFTARWRALTAALERGELQPGCVRARKPRG